MSKYKKLSTLRLGIKVYSNNQAALTKNDVNDRA